MTLRLFLATALLATPAAAQDAPAPRTIQVSGTGVVRTPPDRAVLEYWLRGEGSTPDDATRALAARQKAVTDGLSGLLGRDTELTTGNVTVIEARGGQCEDTRTYGGKPRLSDGACAVTGFIATAQGGIRTAAIDRAGTAAGLAARLGASDARVQSFTLVDTAEANRRALAAALRDAQGRAAGIASGSGLKLGPIVAVRDGSFGAGALIAQDIPILPLNAPSAPRVSVRIDTRPQPVETRAQVFVTYAILP